MALCPDCRSVIPCHCHLNPNPDPTERRDRWETQYARYDAHDYRDLATIGMAIADAEQDGMRATIERLRGELKTAAGPAPATDQGADRAAVLREAAEVVDNPPGVVGSNAGDWGFIHARKEMAVKLRRLADETPPLPSIHANDVAGFCPACGHGVLTLGAGGHVTCTLIDCPKPEAADNLLHGADETPVVAQAAAEVVHGCPPDGSGLTPCCGRTPFELPLGDRISSEAPVTCPGAAVAQPAAPHTDETQWICKCPAGLCGCGHHSEARQDGAIR